MARSASDYRGLRRREWLKVEDNVSWDAFRKDYLRKEFYGGGITYIPFLPSTSPIVRTSKDYPSKDYVTKPKETWSLPSNTPRGKKKKRHKNLKTWWNTKKLAKNTVTSKGGALPHATQE